MEQCQDCDRWRYWRTLGLNGARVTSYTLYTRHSDGKRVCSKCLDGRNVPVSTRLHELNEQRRTTTE